MTTPKFIDKSGREVKAGDVIVYGHALGRCAGLQYARVLALTENPNPGPYFGGEQPMKLRVIGVTTDFGQKPELLSKASTVMFGERVLRVERNQVPADHLKLLDAYVPKETK